MWKILILVPVLLLFIGCDPVVFFKPKDWQEDSQTFVNKYDGFEIAMGSIGDLIGMEQTSAHGCIYNRGKSAAKFEIGKTVLKTGEGEYQGIQNFLHENEIKMIVPASCQPFNVKFEFHKSLDRVLKEPVELEMAIETGTHVSEISIPMVDAFKSRSDN